MKKMYLAIFLIILVVFVFAGCLSFSNTLGTSLTTEEDNYYSEDNTTSVYVPVPGNDTTEAPSVNNEMTTVENVTSAPDVGVNENTTSAESTTSSAPVQSGPVSAPATSEYDILKSGSFYMKGSIIDKTGTKAPMEIAITPDSIYMLSDFSGASMGMLVKDEKVYMIYPDKTAYLELSDSVMSMAGLDINELVSSDSINYGSYGNLSDAKAMAEEEVNGRNCKVYYFDVDAGETRVYLEGTSLVRIATYDKNGKLITSTDIDYITGNVPADKSAPPSSYKAYKGVTGMFSFMTLLEDVME